MIVQLNRRPAAHAVTPTATDLPITPSALPTAGPPPVVAVLGHPGRAAGLSAYLPHGWTLRRPDGLDDIRPDEMVLLAGATVAQVEQARAALPSRTLVVALVDDHAPSSDVAGVLTAGADVCVRGGQPAILAGHLVGCRRRQTANRWAAFNAQPA